MKTYLYMLDTMADWEIGYITAELNSRRFLDKTKPPIPLIRIGNTSAPITTMGGMRITPDECIDDIKFEEDDLLILPGGETWLDSTGNIEAANKKVIDTAADIIDKGVTVAAICGATIALAKIGLLNDRRHTSNDPGFLKMMCPEYTGEAHYQNKPATTNKNLITASGLAPLEFSYEILKKTEAMKPATLEAWFQLYKTGEAKHFFALMESLK